MSKLISTFKGHLTELQISTICLSSRKSYHNSMACLSEGPTTQSIIFLIQKKGVRVKLQNSPAIDTGGVCRQLFSAVLNDFASNKYVRLFDRSSHSLRQICTAESRTCGLFKVLGKMVGHSMCIHVDGIGFPYLSFASYWYLAEGEETAVQFSSINDVGSDVAYVVSKVCNLPVCFLIT